MTGELATPTGPHPQPAGHRQTISAITVLYDAQCPICRRARAWVESQPTHIRVDFVPAGTQAAVERFPDLDHGATLVDITIVDDRGGCYRGESAWTVVLWAVKATRMIANDLAFGRKHRMLQTLKGATDVIRRRTATIETPNAPAAPPMPFAGANAPANRPWAVPGDPIPFDQTVD